MISILESLQAYHNNIEEVYVREAGYSNVWDNGYPSGGSRWSDYKGLDLYSGPNQTIVGSDAMYPTL